MLCFCSFVLSYARAAINNLRADQSPKLFLVFMPRTEFNTLYGQVKSKVPGNLFNISNFLAYYETNADGSVKYDYDSFLLCSPC